MRDGWTEVSLADLLQPVADRAGDSGVELVLSVTEKRGIIPQTEVFNKRIATADTSKYKVLQPLDIAFNPYLLWCGAVGQWLGSVLGVVSPVYECFRAAPGVNARFLGLVFESGLLGPYFDSTAIGSIQRRRRTTVPVFMAARLRVPGLPTQRRIVDLVGSVDAYIELVEQHVHRGRRARSALLDELLGSPGAGWSTVKLEDLLSRSIGGAWGAEPAVDQVDVTVVRSTEFTAPGNLRFETGVTRSITVKQLESRELCPGDLLLEKSGGGPKQPVGRVVAVPSDIPERYVCSNFVQLLRPDSALVDPEFLFLVMWRWHAIGRTLQYQAQTTGIRNLRTKDYLAQPIDLPPLAEQKRIVRLVQSVVGVIESAEIAASDARSLRSALLSELLSGTHEIPDSYDRFRGAA